MNWFDLALAWLFPSLLVEGTPWSQLWNEKERESFLFGCWLFFPLVTAAYIGHYFFYDKPNDLQPLSFWLHFRVFMALAALATFVFYLTPAVKWTWYRLPAVAMCLLMAVSQAYIALWYGREAWMFCYIMILASVLVLRMSALKSLLFVGLNVGLTTPILIKAGTPVPYIFTGTVITMATSMFVRASYLSDVRSFLLSQENIAAQRRIIELNLEFSERIRSFIPRVIAQRIDECMDKQRMSVIEASVEVLTPRKRQVSCLFSDIRGFTQESKELDAFIKDSVIPEVRGCTDAVENFRGIPRKIGDLIFAYFDDESLNRNLLNCVVAGMTLSQLNRDMNATATSKHIRRYVLVSCGEALVGNLGGFDSSIEITALGSPVNLLSRIDELTKVRQVSALIEPGDLVLSEAASEVLAALVPDVSQNRIDLSSLGVKVRDFEDVRYIFSVSPDDHNYACVLRALDDYERKTVSRRDPESVAA